MRKTYDPAWLPDKPRKFGRIKITSEFFNTSKEVIQIIFSAVVPMELEMDYEKSVHCYTVWCDSFTELGVDDEIPLYDAHLESRTSKISVTWKRGEPLAEFYGKKLYTNDEIKELLQCLETDVKMKYLIDDFGENTFEIDNQETLEKALEMTKNNMSR